MNRRDFLNLIKGSYNTSIANILGNDKTVEDFSLRSRAMQG